MLNLLKNTIVVLIRNIYISLIRVPISILYIIYNLEINIRIMWLYAIILVIHY